MLKQMNQIRKMQAAMKEMRATAEREGVSVTLDGTLHAESVSLNPDLPVQKQGDLVRDCFNDAAKKIQTEIARTMSGQTSA